ncbi:uncharacterized protein LOC104891958 [Beta vulgaris subsp. vulgaris]|uniref:uncharacterized protein LOC104891958 n=1 Tax=Beta vulgaris subsp. vulgaris TaxID=3555 RepID=UPI00053FDCB2|nr:uncharacterized protein LOC104891958 [Beta vulgaris subsp. vulgaris]
MEDRCGIRQEIINEGKVLTEEQQRALCMLVTAKDVKRVLMDIPNEKALGNDGYSCFFFKHSWEVVGQDLTAAVLDFFQTGKLLKEINVTSITLIPKVKNASHDYIAQHITMPGHSENVQRAERQKQKCCLVKIDLQKAYDTISWEFLEEL